MRLCTCTRAWAWTLVLIWMTAVVRAVADDDDDERDDGEPHLSGVLLSFVLGAATEVCRANASCEWALKFVAVVVVGVILAVTIVKGECPINIDRRTFANFIAAGTGGALARCVIARDVRDDNDDNKEA